MISIVEFADSQCPQEWQNFRRLNVTSFLVKMTFFCNGAVCAQSLPVSSVIVTFLKRRSIKYIFKIQRIANMLGTTHSCIARDCLLSSIRVGQRSEGNACLSWKWSKVATSCCRQQGHHHHVRLNFLCPFLIALFTILCLGNYKDWLALHFVIGAAEAAQWFNLLALRCQWCLAECVKRHFNCPCLCSVKKPSSVNHIFLAKYAEINLVYFFLIQQTPVAAATNMV